MRGLATAPTPLQESISGAIEQTIADAIAYLPTALSALVILFIGLVVGRLVGGVVTHVVDRIGIGRYTQGTAVEEVSEPDASDGIAVALGKLVAYYIYFVAFVAAADVLDIPQLSAVLGDLAAFLPVILGAVVVLVIGFVVGRVVGDIVADVVGGFNLGPRLRNTPLEQFGDESGEFGRVVGLLVTYYVYLLTLVAVADIVEIQALSDLLDGFAAYLPALVGGLVVLLVGIWVAERVGALVADSGESAATDWAGLAVKLLIYYVTATIALATIGFQTAILTSLFTAFFVAFFGAFAIALAIGIGVAIGLGGQDYVEENIDGWMASVRDASSAPASHGQHGGRTDTSGHTEVRDDTDDGSELDDTRDTDDDTP